MNNAKNIHAESHAVEQTLTDWYSAIKRQDIEAVSAPLAPEFWIVENAELLDRKTLLNRLAEGFPVGVLTATLSDFHTDVHDDVAWTTLRNHEIWMPYEGVAQRVEFIETVVLKKIADRWMIERYHATLLETAPLA